MRHYRVTWLLLFVFSALSLSVAITGCNSSQSVVSSASEVAEEDVDSTIPTLSDVQDVDGFYGLNSDGETITFTNTTIRRYAGSHEDELGYGEEFIADWNTYKTGTSFEVADKAPDIYLYSSGDPIVIDRSSGDKFIIISTVGMPSVYIWPVVYNGYSQADGVADYPEAYEEINGVDAADSSALSAAGVQYDVFKYGVNSKSQRDPYNTFISETPQTLDAAWYEGTQWVDGQLDLSTPFYVSLHGGLPNKDIDLIGSKDGYMEIDITSLAPGLYIVESYYPEMETVIEVR